VRTNERTFLLSLVKVKQRWRWRWRWSSWWCNFVGGKERGERRQTIWWSCTNQDRIRFKFGDDNQVSTLQNHSMAPIQARVAIFSRHQNPPSPPNKRWDPQSLNPSIPNPSLFRNFDLLFAVCRYDTPLLHIAIVKLINH
jgi:hypothetical protein